MRTKPIARQVDSGKQTLPRAKQDGGVREMHLVDESGLEVLSDRGYASAQSDVLAAGGTLGELQRVMNAAGHEVKRCVSPAMSIDARG